MVDCFSFELVVAYSVFTPYYEEDVMYSKQQLISVNEDGISIMFYLQKIFPGTVVRLA